MPFDFTILKNRSDCILSKKVRPKTSSDLGEWRLQRGWSRASLFDGWLHSQNTCTKLANPDLQEGWLRRDVVRAASKGNTLTADDDSFLLAFFSLGRSFRENNYHPFHAQVVMK